MTRLKFCPLCRTHKPTRGDFLACARCRSDERKRLKKRGLA